MVPAARGPELSLTAVFSPSCLPQSLHLRGDPSCCCLSPEAGVSARALQGRSTNRLCSRREVHFVRLSHTICKLKACRPASRLGTQQRVELKCKGPLLAEFLPACRWRGCSVSVLPEPSSCCTRPTHRMEGNLLYSKSTDLNTNLTQKRLNYVMFDQISGHHGPATLTRKTPHPGGQFWGAGSVAGTAGPAHTPTGGKDLRAGAGPGPARNAMPTAAYLLASRAPRAYHCHSWPPGALADSRGHRSSHPRDRHTLDILPIKPPRLGAPS